MATTCEDMSAAAIAEGIDASEATPLLPKNDSEDSGKTITSIPVLQTAIILSIQIAEPITSTVIYPFVNQFVRKTGVTRGKESATGYYAGIIESIFFITEAATALGWQRLSDRYGRRPLLLIAPLGLAGAMLAFGASQVFWLLVVARGFQGAFNGDIGVTKTVMGEITDSSNRASVIALIPPMWSTGMLIGPLIGGVFSFPADHWPNTDDDDDAEPPSAWDMFKIPAVASVLINYGALAFVDMSMLALQPLFWSTSIENGGLGFTALRIGTINSIFGLPNALFQMLIIPRVFKRFGPRTLGIVAMIGSVITISLYPLEHWVTKRRGEFGGIGWVVLIAQLIAQTSVFSGYASLQWYLVEVAPTPITLGTIQGLGQTFAVIGRAIAPPTSTSLFAVSIERHLFSGYFVFVLIGLLQVLAVRGAFFLPKTKVNRNGVWSITT
ncbi:MFS general substrate transporter [Flagelloscypha sp. PMI_526]|nr:MFS general substrate transporter [Flagelloscypha sp. PMI_526]